MNTRSASDAAPAASQPQVIVVDDEASVRASLDSLFRSIGLRTTLCASPAELLQTPIPDAPGCIVLDVRLPGISGLDFQDQLVRQGIDLPIVFITGHGDIPMAVQAMKDGALDFLTKPFRDQDLLDRINTALKQDAENRAAIDKHADLRRRVESLSPREREVLDLIVEGKANKVIAIDLGLSERTVEIHRANVMEKMGARSVAHLVKMHLTVNEH